MRPATQTWSGSVAATRPGSGAAAGPVGVVLALVQGPASAHQPRNIGSNAVRTWVFKRTLSVERGMGCSHRTAACSNAEMCVVITVDTQELLPTWTKRGSAALLLSVGPLTTSCSAAVMASMRRTTATTVTLAASTPLVPALTAWTRLSHGPLPCTELRKSFGSMLELVLG